MPEALKEKLVWPLNAKNFYIAEKLLNKVNYNIGVGLYKYCLCINLSKKQSEDLNNIGDFVVLAKRCIDNNFHYNLIKNKSYLYRFFYFFYLKIPPIIKNIFKKIIYNIFCFKKSFSQEWSDLNNLMSCFSKTIDVIEFTDKDILKLNNISRLYLTIAASYAFKITHRLGGVMPCPSAKDVIERIRGCGISFVIEDGNLNDVTEAFVNKAFENIVLLSYPYSVLSDQVAVLKRLLNDVDWKDQRKSFQDKENCDIGLDLNFVDLEQAINANKTSAVIGI